MADKMNIYVGATAMRTCLGNKTETLTAMHEGRCGLQYDDAFGMYAGVCDVEILESYTRFESMLIEQIDDVVKQSAMTLSDDDVQLIISTTKGNVDLLTEDCDNIPRRAFIYESAKIISQYFNCKNEPVVVSNACISGVSAFVVARDMMLSGRCKHVIVAGCDALCEFITTGFASFKSISAKPCRPYDAERDGLSLGEAAAAVVLTSTPTDICLAGGSITNDTNHISGPSRTGDGLFYAIDNAMKEAGVTCDDIAFVNTHGTATRYNDEMESKAVAWAHLDNKPLNSLKGYIGHTLGASGVVETILCVEQLRRGSIFGTKGFVTTDVPHPLRLSAQEQDIDRYCCVKTASGFGGCNAAIVLRQCVNDNEQMPIDDIHRESRVVAEYILPQSELPFAEFIRAEFKSLGESNMKFYKMSDMSKALYVATERLLSLEGWEEIEPTRRAIILSNSAASLDTDANHQHILNQRLPEGTSPAVFVYTLPNVSAGEMCIRHKIQGDNTFFIENDTPSFAEHYAHRIIKQNRADAVITGWCDYLKGKWNIHVKLLKNN